VLDDMVGLPSDYWEEPTGRNVILVSNIRDDNYYTDYPYYIAFENWDLESAPPIAETNLIF